MKPIRLLAEFDKAGAEWVVVAYLTGDERMIEVVESGKSPHVVTGHYMTGASEELIIKEAKIIGHHTDADTILMLRREHCPEILDLPFLPRTMSIRQCGKKSNHGLNYDEHANTFSLVNEIELAEAKKIIVLYRGRVYPGIPIWYEAVQNKLRKDRTLENCFGRKCRLMGQWGNDLFRQAYAFLPQSTVVDMVDIGMVKCYRSESPLLDEMEILTQTHDSLTTQWLVGAWEDFARGCLLVANDYMRPRICYNGRFFEIKTDLKIGLNWGEEMVEVALNDDVPTFVEDLKRAWDIINSKAQAA